MGQLVLVVLLDFLGKSLVKGFECIVVLIGNEITFRRAISSCVTIEVAGFQFFGEEERYFFVSRHIMVMDVELACEVKACMFVEVDVALHTENTDAHLVGFSDCVVQQFQTIALTLVVGVNTDGAECL